MPWVRCHRHRRPPQPRAKSFHRLPPSPSKLLTTAQVGEASVQHSSFQVWTENPMTKNLRAFSCPRANDEASGKCPCSAVASTRQSAGLSIGLHFEKMRSDCAQGRCSSGPFDEASLRRSQAIAQLQRLASLRNCRREHHPAAWRH